MVFLNKTIVQLSRFVDSNKTQIKGSKGEGGSLLIWLVNPIFMQLPYKQTKTCKADGNIACQLKWMVPKILLPRRCLLGREQTVIA